MKRLALALVLFAGCDDFDALENAALDAGRTATGGGRSGGGGAGGAAGGSAGGMGGGSAGGMGGGSAGGMGGGSAGGDPCLSNCPPVDAGCAASTCNTVRLPSGGVVESRGLALATTGTSVFFALETQVDGGPGFEVHQEDGGLGRFPGTLNDFDARLGSLFVISSESALVLGATPDNVPPPVGTRCQTGAVYSAMGTTRRVAYCASDGGYGVYSLSASSWSSGNDLSLSRPNPPQISLVRPNGSDGALVSRHDLDWVFSYVLANGSPTSTNLVDASQARVASSESQQAWVAATRDGGFHVWPVRGALGAFPPLPDAGSVDLAATFDLLALAVNENNVVAVMVRSPRQQLVMLPAGGSFTFEGNQAYLLTFLPARTLVMPLGAGVGSAWLGFTEPSQPRLHLLLNCTTGGPGLCSGISQTQAFLGQFTLP